MPERHRAPRVDTNLRLSTDFSYGGRRCSKATEPYGVPQPKRDVGSGDSRLPILAAGWEVSLGIPTADLSLSPIVPEL